MIFLIKFERFCENFSNITTKREKWRHPAAIFHALNCKYSLINLCTKSSDSFP